MVAPAARAAAIDEWSPTAKVMSLVRLFEGDEFRRTQLCRDAPAVDDLSSVWQEALKAWRGVRVAPPPLLWRVTSARCAVTEEPRSSGVATSTRCFHTTWSALGSQAG